ncbi:MULTISPECIES: hypothetical protein [unclassified Leptolyngbya]|uniref:hypothetical protein n=1 Tax=unclassified Leptolyngbya TaxID=2650499 RepID=UPI0016824C39|nr:MULTISPECIES: hypothetical protein [unclassified Leptolyngbya]MBD1910397.1 hypothetical protein [Leptolyngbya sp. FACHB-8]MBD2157793.1 hypothetical protein [Leptolyngbya sp. FACHB-16]
MTTLDSPNLWVLFWKNLPVPLRLCLRPWLILSLVLHGLWMLLPMPSDPPPVLEVPEDEQVSLTDIPKVSRSLPASPPALPSSQPSPMVSVAPSPEPVAAAPIPPSVAPVVAPSPMSPAPAAPPTLSTPSPSPTTPAPSPVAPVSPVESSPLPEETPPPTAWATFPHPQGVATCDGVENCWMAPQSRWQQLFRDFEQSLQAEGYVLNDITEQRLSNTTGRRIFAVEKGNEPQYYLNMVSTPDGSTRYLNTEEPLSEAELDQLSGF